LTEGIKVLDHGFVKLLGYYGDDQTIVDAARQSYGKGTRTTREDAGLLSYLMRNGHTSPFEQVNFSFHMKLPIFVARQMVRHRTARLNEYSMRYSEAIDDFYVPELERIMGQDTVNKQGSLGRLDPSMSAIARGQIRSNSEASYETYRGMLDNGVARELARIVLPVNFYSMWAWQMDLNNLFKFLTQRLDAHAQWEIQEYARAIRDIIAPLVPLAFAAWQKHCAPPVAPPPDPVPFDKR
jgi:thymidylate synthase (FAD)